MRASKLILRCYAELSEGQWQAFCLDFSLAAQADTFEEARAKLDEQIREYVCDALTGQDKEHATYLMRRRAPVLFWVKYWLALAFAVLARKQPSPKAESNDAPMAFKEPIPLVPAHC